MKIKTFYLLSSCFLLGSLVSCNDRPDCTNTNEIFNKYSPNIKEYKDELVNQLRLVDNTKLKYWIKEYKLIGSEFCLYLNIEEASVVNHSLHDSDSTEEAENDLSFYDQEIQAECGLEDFLNLIESWLAFI